MCVLLGVEVGGLDAAIGTDENRLLLLVARRPLCAALGEAASGDVVAAREGRTALLDGCLKPGRPFQTRNCEAKVEEFTFQIIHARTGPHHQDVLPSFWCHIASLIGRSFPHGVTHADRQGIQVLMEVLVCIRRGFPKILQNQLSLGFDSMCGLG